MSDNGYLWLACALAIVSAALLVVVLYLFGVRV